MPRVGKRASGQETGSSNKRAATEPSLVTATSTESHHAVAEPDAATEHIAPESLGSAREASPGSGDMTIKSLDDVVSKLASECDESAVALCSAVQTLQRGVQAEIRKLCKPWGVQRTAKNDNGKFSRRADHILKSELTTTFIEKTREHVKAKTSEGNYKIRKACERIFPSFPVFSKTDVRTSSFLPY